MNPTVAAKSRIMSPTLFGLIAAFTIIPLHLWNIISAYAYIVNIQISENACN